MTKIRSKDPFMFTIRWTLISKHGLVFKCAANEHRRRLSTSKRSNPIRSACTHRPLCYQTTYTACSDRYSNNSRKNTPAWWQQFDILRCLDRTPPVEKVSLCRRLYHEAHTNTHNERDAGHAFYCISIGTMRYAHRVQIKYKNFRVFYLLQTVRIACAVHFISSLSKRKIGSQLRRRKYSSVAVRQRDDLKCSFC